MVKTFKVNIENKTVKDGMFNKPIKLENNLKFLESKDSNIGNINYSADINHINEGIVVFQRFGSRVDLLYKLPPQRIVMPSIENINHNNVIWTNDCYMLYHNSRWYLSLSDKNHYLPFFMTNLFWSSDDVEFQGKRFIKICYGRTLAGKSMDIVDVLANIKQYIITILQGQPNTDLSMRRQYRQNLCNGELRRYINKTYIYLSEQHKDIKNQEEAREWYRQNYDNLPNVIYDFSAED